MNNTVPDGELAEPTVALSTVERQAEGQADQAPVVVAPPSQSYGELWRLIKSTQPATRILVIATVLSLFAAAGLLSYPLLTQQLVDGLSAGERAGRTGMLVATVLVAAMLSGAAAQLLIVRTGHAVAANLRHRLIHRMLELSVGFFDRTDTGERVSRVLNDCGSISALATGQVVGLINGLMMLFGSVAILIWLDGWLTLVLMLTMIGAFVAIVPAAKSMEGLASNVQERTARLSGILTHVFSEIRLVKAFGTEPHERERSREIVTALRDQGFRMGRVRIVVETISGLAVVGALVVILIYGGIRVARGDLTIGVLIAFILYIFNVVAPLGQIGGFMAELQAAKGASARLTAILGEPGEPTASGSAIPVRGHALQFEDVRFNYPGREAAVLEQLNLEIAPGTTTALVGLSGSGKSTLLALIERFHEPVGGRILYDGRPIADYDLAAWRGMIGYVSQASSVMPGSVRDNIAYGLSVVPSDDEIREAARKASALAFIEELPQGFQTVLIEQGANLSGGQRQRLALARVFLRNPDLLLLDEATSSLDSETEYEIQQALDTVMSGRTNLVIAHRLSTIMHADRICFLEGGRISGVGTHDELYRDHATYRQLVDLQFRQA